MKPVLLYAWTPLSLQLQNRILGILTKNYTSSNNFTGVSRYIYLYIYIYGVYLYIWCIYGIYIYYIYITPKNRPSIYIRKPNNSQGIPLKRCRFISPQQDPNLGATENPWWFHATEWQPGGVVENPVEIVLDKSNLNLNSKIAFVF